MDITNFLLIGLPGTGKTTITNEIIRQDANIETVSTDAMLKKEYKNPENPVIKSFVTSHQLQSMITTHEIMEKYGEEEFRNLESDLIINELKNGKFKGKVIDLGGKAFLHPKTQTAFKDKGYKAIYLKIGEDVLVDHLLKDYKKYKSGQVALFRSNYNLPTEQAEENFRKTNQSSAEYDVDLALRKSLYNISSGHRKERESLYANASDYQITVSGNLENDVLAIKNIMEKETKKSKPAFVKKDTRSF